MESRRHGVGAGKSKFSWGLLPEGKHTWVMKYAPWKSHLAFCKERGTFLRTWPRHLIPCLQSEAFLKDYRRAGDNQSLPRCSSAHVASALGAAREPDPTCAWGWRDRPWHMKGHQPLLLGAPQTPLRLAASAGLLPVLSFLNRKEGADTVSGVYGHFQTGLRVDFPKIICLSCCFSLPRT